MQSVTVKPIETGGMHSISLANTPADPIKIARGLNRRPSYVQAFLILSCVSENPQKVYQVARVLALDYYQCQKRVEELARKGFIKVVNGNVRITEEGREMKEILEQVIVRMHPTEGEEVECFSTKKEVRDN